MATERPATAATPGDGAPGGSTPRTRGGELQRASGESSRAGGSGEAEGGGIKRADEPAPPGVRGIRLDGRATGVQRGTRSSAAVASVRCSEERARAAAVGGVGGAPRSVASSASICASSASCEAGGSASRQASAAPAPDILDR